MFEEGETSSNRGLVQMDRREALTVGSDAGHFATFNPRTANGIETAEPAPPSEAALVPFRLGWGPP
jgi:hypothetical protein